MLNGRRQPAGRAAQRFVMGWICFVCGCANPSILRLDQPHLPEPQRRLDLLSEQVYWTESDGVYRVLAEIPLPGASTGRPAYLVYLRFVLPPDQEASPPVGADVRGFLIQTRGSYAGLVEVADATVTAHPPDAPGQTTWSLHADLHFDDGSRLSGDLIAARGDWRLRQLETRTHAADVRALLTPPAPIVHQSP